MNAAALLELGVVSLHHIGMTDGYLFRVLARSAEGGNAFRQYWYANIADRSAAMTAVMLAAAAVTIGVSVELVSYISQDTFSWLGIPLGELRRD